MRYLPFTEEQLQRIFLIIILIVVASSLWLVASLAGLPAIAHARFAQVSADAGFEVRRVTVTGTQRMNAARVYEQALSRRDRPMASLDLAVLRDDLLELPWVGDARVSRHLPDTLAIDIVERQPRAVLVDADRLSLIDDEGVVLQTIGSRAAEGLLRVAGPGASKRIKQLDRLMMSAPALKPHVQSAQWIGNRRWNLTFDTGQVLALPEGEPEAASALIAFARLDGVNRLLGGKVAAFDMRAPERIYMRIPGRSEEVAALAQND